MPLNSGCLSVPRSEYLTLFLHLRKPLASTRPFVRKWKEIVSASVGNVRVRGWEVLDAECRDYRSTRLDQLRISGRGSLGLVSADHVPKPKRIEFLLLADYAPSMVCSGFDFGPSILVVFGLSYMTEEGVRELDSRIVDWLGECAQLTNAQYGVIDIADSMETGIGRWLGPTDQLYASFPRRLARRMWAREVRDGPKAIGVFWGNLFGPEMIKRMGGLSVIKREMRRMSGGRHPDPVRECPDGGAIVTLSSKIADFMYPHFGVCWPQFDHAEWLHRRLAQAGLLPGLTDVPVGPQSALAEARRPKTKPKAR